MDRGRNFLTLGVTLATLAGCGGDAARPVTTGLTARQSQQVITALMAEIAAATSPALMEWGLAVAAARNAAAEEYSFDASCSAGGRIHGSGDALLLLSPNGTGTQSMDLRYTPVGCVLELEGLTLVVDGDPSLTYQWSASYTNHVLEGDIQFYGRGSIVWTGDTSGECLLDYSVTVPPGGPGYMSGVMCNQNISGPL